MNAKVVPVSQNVGFVSRAAKNYEEQTGQPLIVWALVALGNFAMQVILCRASVGPNSNLDPGEFGTLNAALGIIGLLTVPIIALQQAFQLYPLRPQVIGQGTRFDLLRASALTVTETSVWIWGAACFLLTLVPQPAPLPFLPRVPLQILALMNVLLALGGVLSYAVCRREGQFRLWSILLVAASVTRLLGISGLTAFAPPWADWVLTVFLVAGIITLVPALRPREADIAARLKTFRDVFDRNFLLFAGATFSVLLGIYLFTNADRIASLRWVDVMPRSDVVVGLEVRKIDFDRYQAAGLLGRALLWGTQPLLWLLFAARSRLGKTSLASLMFFWIYLGALVAGAVVLNLCTQTGVLRVLGWPAYLLGPYGPTFAVVMVPLGILQGLGIFSLASRRYPECFVLGGCSVAYTLVLLLFGRRPELMPTFMFGASLVSLMAVLFVGVVRWGRKQP